MAEITEFYRRKRPLRLADVLGQEAAIKPLAQKLKAGTLPHTILLTGPSGAGKTTIAMILADRLKCHPNDYTELNCASDARGIDTIRELRFAVRRSPLKDSRIWIFNEVQATTREFQQAALDLFEFTPTYAYFLLTTNEPEKLLPALRSRCFHVGLRKISDKDMADLVQRVAQEEAKKPLTKAVCDKLVDFADGNARLALVTLERLLEFADEQDQLNAIVPLDTGRDAFEIVKALLWQEVTWAKVAAIISGLNETNWEGLRHLVLANAVKEMLKPNGNQRRASCILTYFENSWMYSGKAGLVNACWSVLQRK